MGFGLDGSQPASAELKYGLLDPGGGAACVAPFTIDEYPERFPAASVALTLYLYIEEAARPVSLYELVVGVPICEKFVQEEPKQRSTLYPVTPTASVDAVHERLI